MAVFTLAYIVLWAAATSGQPTDRVLVHTMDDIGEEITKLVLSAGDPDVWLRNLEAGDVSTYSWDWTTQSIRPGSVAVDYNLPDSYFLHDRNGGQIYHYNGESGYRVVASLYGGSSPQLGDMALDWIGQNIYYTDENQIGLWSYKNERYQVIVEDLREPHGIDVDPVNGYLFWAEPARQRIMKSSLWGTNAAFVVSGVNNVQTITVNPDTEMIYWINEDDNSVRTADYNGQQRSLFLERQSPDLAGIEIYKDSLFLLERRSRLIQAYNRSTAIEIETFGLNVSGSFRQQGIAMSSPETQPMTQHACTSNNGGCQHICIPDQNDVQCLCQFGYTLNNDQLSCGTGYNTDEVLFVLDEEAKKLYQVELVTGEVHDVIVSPSINIPVVVTFDPIESMVYWVDLSIGDNIIIRRKSLTSTTDDTFLTLGTAQCDALAIDAIGRKLYFGNDQRNSIIAKSLDTGREDTLIQQNSYDAFTGIQLDTANGHIYWTNVNSLSSFLSRDTTIERADLGTGRNQRTIISGTNIRTPYGLALDLPGAKMYWCDHYHDKVERSNLDGTNREEIYDTDVGTCFGVAVDRTYVYVTSTHAIIRIEKATKAVSYLGKQLYWRIVSLTSYSSSYMPPSSKCHPLFEHGTVMFLVVLNVALVILSRDA